MLFAAVATYLRERPPSTHMSPEEATAFFGLGIGLFVVIGFFLLLIHFMPAFVAFQRGHENALAITVLNIVLGWTFIGWAIAMVWAFTGPGRRRYKKSYRGSSSSSLYQSDPEWES